MMDPTTFQIFVVNHLEKLLEGQAALVNCFTNAVELFHREFQLLRNGVRYQNHSSGNIDGVNCTDSDISFQKLNKCLTDWKASLATGIANDVLRSKCLTNESSDLGEDDTTYSDIVTSQTTINSSKHANTSSVKLNCINLDNRTASCSTINRPDADEDSVNEEELIKAEVMMDEEDDGDYMDQFIHESVSSHPPITTRQSTKYMSEEEKVCRRRELAKRRAAAYRLRKKAAVAGLPPPDFARLKIPYIRSSKKSDVNDSKSNYTTKYKSERSSESEVVSYVATSSLVTEEIRSEHTLKKKSPRYEQEEQHISSKMPKNKNQCHDEVESR